MLVLSRKQDEKIMIGDNIVITIFDIRCDKVRVGIDAPKSVSVHRQEVYEAIKHGEAQLEEFTRKHAPKELDSPGDGQCRGNGVHPDLVRGGTDRHGTGTAAPTELDLAVRRAEVAERERETILDWIEEFGTTLRCAGGGEEWRANGYGGGSIARTYAGASPAAAAAKAAGLAPVKA